MSRNILAAKCGVVFYPIVFPAGHINLEKWAVVACDQYTADTAYWKDVETFVGDAPSTLHCIYPEVYLNQDPEPRIAGIQKAMDKYLSDGTLQEQAPGCMFIRRETSYGSTRYGVVAALDLEHYDYTPGSQALVRATEKTILERIPPRVAIRKDAALEFPHVLVLYNDPEQRLHKHFLDLVDNGSVTSLYQTPLMKNGGLINGFYLQNENELGKTAKLFDSLLPENPAQIMFAVGDGNHSLATAKHIWDELKKHPDTPSDHPARFALVEFINLHDSGLGWEPIHRVLFDTDTRVVLDYLRSSPGMEIEAIDEAEIETFRTADSSVKECLFIADAQAFRIRFTEMQSVLVVGELQALLDNARLPGELDYIHGFDETLSFGRQKNAAAFLLPAIDPEELFNCVENEGVLPRKTFSLGHADEKRFYMEAKRIR